MNAMKSANLIIAFILILSSLICLSTGKIGYDIDVSVGGTSWYISRFAQNMSFDNEETVYGSGNLSRYNHLKATSDQDFSGKTSVVRGGNFSLEGDTRSKTREGPVSISYNLNSFINETDAKLDSNEAANITIDEAWPSRFLNYKSIRYEGRAIRTSERYDSEGETISSSSDSSLLEKVSAYSTIKNRLRISAQITPYGAFVERNSNRSMAYILSLKSKGSLSTLDVIKTQPADEKTLKVPPKTLQISQEYRGLVNMGVKISSNDVIPVTKNNDSLPCYESCVIDASDYLPACIGYEYNLINADSVFNCSCA